ncbi:MAG: Nre family DNA repair protein [Candidatus Micrarchaeaceae archaeon]
MLGAEARKNLIKEIERAAPAVKRSDIVYRHMRDPALLRYYYRVKMMPVTDKLEISGSSPTDIFIGRFGYPKVFIGPMVPPTFGDTSILGTPERWRKLSIPSIVSYRSKLVRGMHLTRIDNVENGRIEEMVRDLAMSERPAETEMNFNKKPFIKLSFNDEVQPFGPSAVMKSMDLYNVKADRKIERAYSDTDAKASTAIMELYEGNIPVSKIQQVFSAGALGVGKARKFVPTRWSITAVDDTISKNLLKKVKEFDSLDSIYAFYHVSLDNRWLIVFMPGNWEYESAEAWYPNTVWNENGIDISIYSSYEGYNGRTTYAEIGGCYYAARLAVAEKLTEMKGQGRVIILREVHEGYLMPVGVWNVREHVREALTTPPIVLNTTEELFELIQEKMDITLSEWIRNCRILRDIKMQKRISDYLINK